MSKSRIKINQVVSSLKKRNPERVLMDRVTRPAVFRSRRNTLNDRDAQAEIKDYMRGIE